MTVQFQPPPSYAEVFLLEGTRVRFNPIWQRWFLELAGLLSSVNGGSGAIDHNLLSSLQGGTTSEYYHLTQAQHAAVAAFVSSGFFEEPQSVPVAASYSISSGKGVAVPGPFTLDGDLTLNGDLLVI